MRKIEIVRNKEISLSDKRIEGFMLRKICKSSTGAVIYIPREFEGKDAYVVICK